MFRILVVSYSPFSKKFNNGKTLSSFFAYNNFEIAQLSFSDGDGDLDVCSNYYILTNGDAVKKRIGTYKNSFQSIVENESELHSFSLRLFNLFSSKRISLFLSLKNYIWKRANYEGAKRWIKSFNPDAIFLQGFGLTYAYELSMTLSKEYSIPLFLELTDDYTTPLRPFSLFEQLYYGHFRKVLKKAIEYSSCTFVISDLMKEEYGRRYAGKFHVLMNLVHTKEISHTAKRTIGDYVYAGNIYLGRWEILLRIGQSFDKLGDGRILTIYTPDIPKKNILKKLLQCRSIKYGGSLSKQELEKRLLTAEYLVHVESFDRKNRIITRLSMSTKIPEYLASGAKIMAVGPKNIASIDFFLKNKIGLVCTRKDSLSIFNSLKHCTIHDCKQYIDVLKRFEIMDNNMMIKEIINEAIVNNEGNPNK